MKRYEAKTFVQQSYELKLKINRYYIKELNGNVQQFGHFKCQNACSTAGFGSPLQEGKVGEGLTVNLVYDWTVGGTPLKAPSPKAH